MGVSFQNSNFLSGSKALLLHMFRGPAFLQVCNPDSWHLCSRKTAETIRHWDQFHYLQPHHCWKNQNICCKSEHQIVFTLISFLKILETSFDTYLFSGLRFMTFSRFTWFFKRSSTDIWQTVLKTKLHMFQIVIFNVKLDINIYINISFSTHLNQYLPEHQKCILIERSDIFCNLALELMICIPGNIPEIEFIQNHLAVRYYLSSAQYQSNENG